MAMRAPQVSIAFLIASLGSAWSQTPPPPPEWDYILPQEWALSYPACGGRQQSPIDIVPARATTTAQAVQLSSLVAYNTVTGLQVRNTGHGLQVDNNLTINGGLGNITINGATYVVLQFHVHFPSEHTRDGQRAAGELHVVHRKVGSTGTDGLLVIGLFFQLGLAGPLLTRLGLPVGAPLTETSTPTPLVGPLNLFTELGSQLQGSFYSYDGSLTTPPCAETVKWFVLDKMQTVDQQQVAAFKALYGNPANARPIQALGGRLVIKDSLLGCPKEVNVPWNYVLPQCWASSYPSCGGMKQSPVNLDPAALAAPAGSEQLSAMVNYLAVTSGLAVKNTGHGLQVNSPNAVLGSTTVGGQTYNLLQFHFHFPSEHAIEGRLFAGELHIVHQLSGATGNNNLLVIGVPIQLGGADSPFFTALGLPTGAPWSEDDAPVPLNSTINLSQQLQTQLQGGFWRYDGSLTTPPCSETVSWFVLDTPINISRAQVDAFKARNLMDPANRRPLQLLNGRPLLRSQSSTSALAVNSSLVGCPTTVASRLRRRMQEGAGAPWDYLAPQCWATAYPTCGGRAQSPVDIATAGPFGATGTMNLASLTSYIPLSDRVVTNTGKGLQVSAAGMGGITIQGGTYPVRQFHIHCPSEHTLDGVQYACELHIVHQKAGSTGTDDMLVIGLLFAVDNAAPDDNFLSLMGLPTGAPAIGSAPVNIAGTVNLLGAFGNAMRQGFYRYDGSLTTPPCAETVSWFVVSQALAMSRRQLDAFKAIFGSPMNNRPVQLLNGRSIFKNMLPGCYVESDKRRLQAAPEWGYVLPSCWALNYPFCGGQQQSPINIDTSLVSAPGNATITLRHGQLAGASLRNTGHGIQVPWSTGGIIYGGQLYNTLQFHFHLNSEHAIDGKLYAAEMHIVHQKSGSTGTNDLLVMGVLYQVGAASNLLAQLGLGLPNIVLPGVGAALPVPSSQVQLDDEISNLLAQGYYTYLGSLTTPPCSEDVTWVVLASPQTATQEQLSSVRALYPDPANNRPLQPLYGRVVGKNIILGADTYTAMGSTTLTPSKVPDMTANVATKDFLSTGVVLLALLSWLAVPALS